MNWIFNDYGTQIIIKIAALMRIVSSETILYSKVKKIVDDILHGEICA